MDSIPKLAKEFGMSTKDYEALADIAREVSKMEKLERQIILDSANKSIPRETGTKWLNLVESLAYDREFCERAGIDYANPPEGIFTTAIAKYLLNITS
jgi:hypothetical protein